MAALMHETPMPEPRRLTIAAEPVARFFALAVVPEPEPATPPAPTPPPLRVIPGGREAALRRRLPAHVYRRRRLLVLVGALLVAVVATVTLGVGQFDDTATAGTTTADAEVQPGVGGDVESLPESYVVQPGDTLWSIAHKLRPTDDPRSLVDELASRNGGSSLEAGARLDLRGLAAR